MVKRRAAPEQVIARYQELRNLEKTGHEFGVSRERVRQIVKGAGITTARATKPKPDEVVKNCLECGAAFSYPRARYCSAHRGRAATARRVNQRRRADPVRYARWQQQVREAS